MMKRLLAKLVIDFLDSLTQKFTIAKYSPNDVDFCFEVHCLADCITKSGYKQQFKLRRLRKPALKLDEKIIRKDGN